MKSGKVQPARPDVANAGGGKQVSISNIALSPLEESTVFGMVDMLNTRAQLEQVRDFKIEVLVRGWMHWNESAGESRLAWVVNECRQSGILFAGGGVINQAGAPAWLFGADRTRFFAMMGLDAWGKPSPSEHNGRGAAVYSGSLYNEQFREAKLERLKQQIDIGVQLLHFDVIVQLWHLNDKFDDDTIEAFRRFLRQKHGQFSAADWAREFDITALKPWGDISGFNYRTYLQQHKYADGRFFADDPYRSENPLAREWGRPAADVRENPLLFQEDFFPPESFLGETVRLVSSTYADAVRSYGRTKGKTIWVSFNGPNSCADFQVDSRLISILVRKLTNAGLARFLTEHLDEMKLPLPVQQQTRSLLATVLNDPLAQPLSAFSDRGKTLAPPQRKKFEELAQSARMLEPPYPLPSTAPSCRTLVEKCRKLGKAGEESPVVFFVDYPQAWQQLRLWRPEDETKFLAVLCAEAYAVGGRFAFMPGFLQHAKPAYARLNEMARFISTHNEFYRRGEFLGQGNLTGLSNSITTVWWKRPGRPAWVGHVINRGRAPATAIELNLPQGASPNAKVLAYAPSQGDGKQVPVQDLGDKVVARLARVDDYVVLTVE